MLRLRVAGAAAGGLALLPGSTAAAPAAAPAAARGAAFSASASAGSRQHQHQHQQHQHTEQHSDLYSVLGVQPGASQAELKAAFRRRAKELHPDASPAAAASGPAFVQLLAAYKVLSNPRSRQLYDLSRDSAAAPRVLRAAAAAGVHAAADAAYEEAPVDLSWGLGRILHGPAAEGGALDHVRRELQGELHSAVRLAYLGPKLSPEALEGGQLPDAFEADERAVPDCAELLQIVSGRQVLGAVRERRRELLAARQAAVEAALHAGFEGPAAALPGGEQGGSSGVQVEQQQDGSPEEQQQIQQSLPGDLSQAEHTSSGASAEREQQPCRAQHAQHGQQAQLAQREPDVLDLYVGEQLVASAVRHFPRSGSSGSSNGSEQQSLGGHVKQQPAQQQQRDQQQAFQQQSREQPSQQLPAEVIGVYLASGELLAQIESQQADPGSSTASSARLLDARGRHTHTVFRTQTPLVRHLTFAAEPAATGLRTARPSRLVVCRARRAWLPPSSLWLFRPLSHTHDVGGWCLEWAGAEQKDHPAALHPAVFVLTAAFDSLDHERAARQPLGLFGRLRAARRGEGGGGQEEGGGQAEEARGGWRGWLAGALRFHGRGLR